MWTAVGHPGALPVSQRPRTGRGTAPSAPLGPPRAQHLAPAFSATPPQGWPQNTGSSVHLQSQQGSWGTTSPAQTAPTTPNCLSHRPWKEKQARPFPSHSRPPLPHTCRTHADTLSVHCENQVQGPGHGRTTKPWARNLDKAWCGELSIEHQRPSACSALPPTPAPLRPPFLGLPPGSFHVEVLLSGKSSQGTAAFTLPTPGPRVHSAESPAQLWPACGPPGPGEPCRSRGKCQLQPQPPLHGSSSRERRDSSRWLSMTFSCWT